MLGNQRTENEQRRIDHIHEWGCVPCWLEAALQGRKWVPEPCDIHHVVQGDHSQTYGCCPWHHRGMRKIGTAAFRMAELFGPSMAKEPERYRARYGTEDELLAYQRRLLIKSPTIPMEATHGPG